MFFLLIAIHQIQKYLQNLKFVKLHSEDFFSHLLKWGSQNCVVYMLLTAPKHIYMWPASRT